MDKPTFHFHPLAGDQSGRYSVRVDKSWRVTFGWLPGGPAAIDVDYEDYHEEADMLYRSKRHPSIPVDHPAGYLREDALPALGVSKTAFARALGVSRQTLYDLLDEKQGISAAMAMRLEKVIGGSAESWLNLQMAHDLWKARKEIDVSKLKRLREPKRVREAAE